ncbi:Jacalin-like lectin domain superfamily [Arabidopsis suecica]|uniref:Jacalin-like lectin domain superfamily n=1 Tax=Arabidopsis suecica TaxID=45249 RepID=A0A8T2ASH7_ARASU|nr:Jacalin-like lectin domain superfamily [Arabidopsis suecica]
MIRAGSVGKISHCEYTYWDGSDAPGEEVMGDDSWDDKGRTKISHIYVAFDEVIMSIQFGFLQNGALVLSEKYGAFEEGSNFRVLRLNQDEYVTGLSGVLEKDGGGIRNLTLRTNLGEYMIGRSSDNYPSDSTIDIDPAICDRREFGGFFGSYNRYRLTSIGMYLSPITSPDMVVKRENN